MSGIHYDLIRKNGKTLGLLLSDAQYAPPIYGKEAEIETPASACRLDQIGRLHIFAGFEWDFGSGPAIDTPAVIRASLAHDALCLLTDNGLIPWECRAKADAYYRHLLMVYGASKMRAWYQWAGVRAYSKSVAYWKRTK